MNATDHQEKEKNEETKKGKRKETKKTTDFEEAVCCPTAGGSIAKK